MHPMVVMVFVAYVLQSGESAQWTSPSPPDKDIVYVCSDDMVTLAWNYTLDPGEKLGNIEWHRNGASRQLVATKVGGNFFPAQSFASYVKPAGKAGIILESVMSAKTGNYSVSVHVYGTSKKHFSLTRSVFLQVDGQLQTPGGSVQATQVVQAVMDHSTNNPAIELRCGNFTYTWKTPLQAQWTTPAGRLVASSDYSDGHFNLMLNPPVQGGNYTCRVPSDRACLSNPKQGEATVYVDLVDARLDLLEMEREHLTEHLEQTSQKLNLAKSELDQTKSELDQYKVELNRTKTKLQESENKMHSLHSKMGDTDSKLTQTTSGLTPRVQRLEASGRKVGFHAQHLRSTAVSKGRALLFSEVTYNGGSAYEKTTGYFKAPVSGLYLFIATTGSDGRNSHALYNLVMNNNKRLSRGYSFFYYNGNLPEGFSPSTVHAAVHLDVGDTVCVKSAGRHMRFRSEYSAFSGALISPTY